MTEGLRPCPYCGSRSVGDAGIWRHVIKCHRCGSRSAPFSEWNEAVRAWNTRTLSPKQKHADELFDALWYVLIQLKLAFMGYSSTRIDANKLDKLHSTIVREEALSRV